MRYESVGPDFKAAVEAMQRRQATLEAVGSGVAVKQDGDPNRKRVVDEVKKFLAKKSLLKDPKTVKTYTERLGYLVSQTAQMRGLWLLNRNCAVRLARLSALVSLT